MTAKQPDLHRRLADVAARETPLLPRQELQDFVQYYFSRRDSYLQTLKKHPAPLYLQETSVLKDRARRLKKAFQGRLPAVAFYYAVKSNNHPAVAQAMLAEDFGLDVSSGLELEMALSLSAGDIIFSGPGKTDAELSLAAAHADRVVVLIDSFGELGRLESIAAGSNKTIRCGVRLSVNPRGLWRKFGIALQDLPSFWDEARRCEHVQLHGLQFHSSWNLSPGPQMEFIRRLGVALVDLPQKFKDQLEFIDIGGGYWPEQGEWLQAAGTPMGTLHAALGLPAAAVQTHHRLPADPIEKFAAGISDAIHTHLFPVVQCRIFLEPGRWICNDAVQLIISVVDKKADDLVITDAGTNTVGWERFETDYCPILNLTRPALSEKPCQILGSLCTPHDLWGHAYFGDDIQPGDILLIPAQGAYTYSLRQNFIKPLPSVVTI